MAEIPAAAGGLVLETATDFSIDGAGSATISVTASNSNRLIVVCIGFYSAARAVSSMTRSTDTITQYAAQTSGADFMTAEIWRGIAPASGANDLVITMSNATSWAGGTAYCFSGAHQTVPLGTAATGTALDSTATSTASSAVGEIVVDAVALDLQVGARTATAGAGQTEQQNVGLSSIIRALSSNEAGAASTVMSWALSGNTSWSSVSVGVKPV